MRQKQTKIVATISDRKCDVEFLRTLYENGMNVVRVNTAHQQPEDTLKIIKNVREVSDRLAILIDTKGPEIRTSPTEGDVVFEEDTIVKVRSDNYHEHTTEQIIRVSYTHFVAEVPVGQHILIDDGVLTLEVLEKNNEELTCKVLNSAASKEGTCEKSSWWTRIMVPNALTKSTILFFIKVPEYLFSYKSYQDPKN